MLSEELKGTIQAAYSELLSTKGYRARQCQKIMIAEVAKTLGEGAGDKREQHGHVAVIEAGTGTGKTIAYMLAAIPVARALGKRLVVATATVALQEQIVGKDLPDIGMGSGLPFSYALAKGRRRYLCLARLDTALQDVAAPLPLFDDEGSSMVEHKHLLNAMVQQLLQGDWSGDRDDWESEIDDSIWQHLTSDHAQCTNRQCSHFDNCVYFKSREDIFRVDCIVANQDLVLSDLEMGGGAVLPEPEDTIYIFDEGHHLPDKAINHGQAQVVLGDDWGWLEQLPRMLEAVRTAGASFSFSASHQETRVREMIAGLLSMRRLLDAVYATAATADSRDNLYRFPLGRVPEEVRSLAHELAGGFDALSNDATRARDAAEEAMRDEDAADVETLMPVVGTICRRLETARDLWRAYSITDDEADAPTARWIESGESDLRVSSSPIDVAKKLRDLLWDRCHAAVVTSATLAVAGDFSRFCIQAGIENGANLRALASPFRHAEQGELYVPQLDVDPRDPEAHWTRVAEMLPELLAGVRGALVLFTSWRQMLAVKDLVPEAFLAQVLVQGELSRAEIVAQHRLRVDAGARSIIFGLASFAEGIDLPGAYCEQVVIAKIPFATPDDPVGATINEWTAHRGGNPFREISLPDAALRLVQACGRLLRTESDTGRITILDRRLVSAWYGDWLLRAIPPFRRNIKR